jgi:hypothetical protein
MGGGRQSNCVGDRANRLWQAERPRSPGLGWWRGWLPGVQVHQQHKRLHCDDVNAPAVAAPPTSPLVTEQGGGVERGGEGDEAQALGLGSQRAG